jgi:hypothetical protein
LHNSEYRSNTIPWMLCALATKVRNWNYCSYRVCNREAEYGSLTNREREGTQNKVDIHSSPWSVPCKHSCKAWAAISMIDVQMDYKWPLANNPFIRWLSHILPNGMMEVEAVRRRRGFLPYSSASCPVRVNPIVLKIPPTCNWSNNWLKNMQHWLSKVAPHNTAITVLEDQMECRDALRNMIFEMVYRRRRIMHGHGGMDIPRTGGRWGR